MSRPATLEQSIPLQVQTQKEIMLRALRQHKEHVDELICNIERSQTLEELVDNMREAAKNMI